MPFNVICQLLPSFKLKKKKKKERKKEKPLCPLQFLSSGEGGVRFQQCEVYSLSKRVPSPLKVSGGGGVEGGGAGCLGRICFRDKRSKEDGREDAKQKQLTRRRNCKPEPKMNNHAVTSDFACMSVKSRNY